MMIAWLEAPCASRWHHFKTTATNLSLIEFAQVRLSLLWGVQHRNSFADALLLAGTFITSAS